MIGFDVSRNGFVLDNHSFVLQGRFQLASNISRVHYPAKPAGLTLCQSCRCTWDCRSVATLEKRRNGLDMATLNTDEMDQA